MFTRKFLFVLTGLCAFNFTFSQVPEDVLRNAWFIPNGTARTISVGGATGALGGDISSIYVNPAGLGFYKTKEAVLTPGFLINMNKANFRGTSSDAINKQGFQLGTSGVVVGGKPIGSNNTSAFSIAVNQIASYNNQVHYEGLNNYSSYSEQFLEELVNDNADINAATNNYPFGSSLAFFTYLVDSIADPQGGLLGYRSLVPVPEGIMQEYDETDKGGLYEVSFAFASDKMDKLYLGASINVPLSFFTQDIDYMESDPSDNSNNDFNYSKFSQHHTLNGAGINARLGIIYRPGNSLRLGFAFHTPSLMSFSDNLDAEMTTDTEGYKGVRTSKSSEFPNAAGQIQYNEITPYRLVASAAYVFREVEDVKLQKGFVSADVEFVNYRGSRFMQQGEENDPALTDYYNSLNDVIKSYYKGAFNFRIGGELKFSPFAMRLGAAYYGNPYKDNSLKANRILAAAGLGYRNHGMFVDVAFAESFNKDISFPYRLADKANTFAELKNQRANVLLTIGIKF